MSDQPGIEFKHVSRAYGHGKNRIFAVNDVSFEIQPGKTLCLVGESGCGKSTTGRMVAGLIPPSEGSIMYHGTDLRLLSDEQSKRFRRTVQMIHQDPYASLTPHRSVYQMLAAPLKRHKMVKSQHELVARMEELLTMVGLTPPQDFLNKYPHQLSGGQRQRVSIARALTVNPEFLVADEAVSMVDVSLRVSLLNILMDLQDRLGVTFVMITHDLAVAKHFAWEGHIGVMYLGQMVEIGPTQKVLRDPIHPYTRALLSALPEADPELTRSKQRMVLRSPDIPSLLHLPDGCTFHPRCPMYEEGLCDIERPASDVVSVADHKAACFVMANSLGQSERIPLQLRTRHQEIKEQAV